MVAVGAAYIPLEGRAEACEFRLATARLVAPQVRAATKMMSPRQAKSELKWFLEAHTGFEAEIAATPISTYYTQWLFKETP